MIETKKIIISMEKRETYSREFPRKASGTGRKRDTSLPMFTLIRKTKCHAQISRIQPTENNRIFFTSRLKYWSSMMQVICNSNVMLTHATHERILTETLAWVEIFSSISLYAETCFCFMTSIAFTAPFMGNEITGKIPVSSISGCHELTGCYYSSYKSDARLIDELRVFGSEHLVVNYILIMSVFCVTGT